MNSLLEQLENRDDMLTPIHSLIFRYLFMGIGLGLLFPILSTMVACYLENKSFSVANFAAIQRSNSLLWIIDTAPFTLGGISVLLGVKQNQIKTLVHFLTYRLERKTDELTQAKYRLENILHHMADLLIVMDIDGIISEVNSSTLRDFGYEKNELIGQAGHILFGKDSSKIITQNPEVLFERGIAKKIEGVYPTRNGDFIYLDISVSRMFDDKGHIMGTICVAQDISDRKVREIELERVKSQFESLFNAAPLTIVVTQNNQIVFFNKMAVEHLGYTPGEFAGFPIKKIIHPDDLEKLEEQENETVHKSSGISSSISYRVKTKTNETLWVNMRSTPFTWEEKPAFLNFIIDITENRKMERALAESEKKFRDLVQTLNVIIVKVDSDFKYTFINRFGIDFFGFSEDELLGRSAMETIIPEVESTGRKLHTVVRELFSQPEQLIVIENENIKRSGERVWISWRNRPVYNEDGDLVEIMSLGTDITEKKKADDVIKNQNALLLENQRRMMNDMDQAKIAQSALMAGSLPSIPEIRLATRYRPIAQIGGDFYDLFHDDEDNLGILIGDVTGHGIPAALLSFLFLTTFKSYRRYGGDPDQAIDLSNRFLAGKLPEGKYATIFKFSYTISTGILRYSSAGHPPAMLLKQGADKITYLQTNGMVVGFFNQPAIPFETKEIQLKHGDKIIIYTDGILEVLDENNRIQTVEALEDFIISIRHRPISEMIDLIVDYALKGAKQNEFADDVTLIGLEIVDPDF